MGVTTREYSVLAIFLWMLIILGFMALAQVVNLEIFFVLWLIGVLVIMISIGAAGSSATCTSVGGASRRRWTPSVRPSTRS